jgi:hypothetical protein
MFRDAAIILALMVVTLVIYWPANAYDFIDLDDGMYVQFNEQVMAGLTPAGVHWALTQGHAANWHPLTWISLMIDRDLWGPEPRGFHITNIVIHAMNSALLFIVLRRIAQAVWPSAIVAAWFALHPAHVESVAWISERKDVLSMLFWLLTMLAYGYYAASPRIWKYGLVAMLFALGLMSKPMLVTLPAVLLLMDLWPLQRIRFDTRNEAWRSAVRLVVEKLPLLAMVAASCVITLIVQRRSGAVADIPRSLHLANMPVSYVRYVAKLFWPVDLCVYYPFPGVLGCPPWPAWIVVASMLVVIVVTIGALALMRSRPWWTFGWLWFLGTLVPVIGIVPIGNQSIADRYTYVPLVGLFIAVAWEGLFWAGRSVVMRIALSGAAIASIVACAMLTARQLPVWRNTDTLFQHALAVTTCNWRVHDYYGNYLMKQGRTDEAVRQYEAAVQLAPEYVASHYGLGVANLEGERYYEAVTHLRKAVEVKPDHAESHYRLGLALSARRDYAAAIDHVQRAIDLDAQRAPEYRQSLHQMQQKMQRNMN